MFIGLVYGIIKRNKKKKMTIFIFILTPIFLAELVLGVFLLVKYRRGAVNSWYTLFVFAVTAWVGTNIFLNGLQFGEQSLILEKVTWFIGVFITSFFLMFSFYFPFSKKKLSKSYLWLVIVPAIFFTVIIFSNDLFIKEVIESHSTYTLVTGPLYFTFPVFFIFYWMWSVINLVTKFRIADGLHKWQLKYLLMGILIPLPIVLVTDILLPTVTDSALGWVGSVSSIIWLGFSAYIIYGRSNKLQIL